MRRGRPALGIAICWIAIALAGCTSGATWVSVATAPASAGAGTTATAPPSREAGPGAPSPGQGTWTPATPSASAQPPASAAATVTGPTPSAVPLPRITAGHLRRANTPRGYTYDVAYPSLTGDEPAFRRVNVSIRARALRLVNGFLSDTSDVGKIEPDEPSELTATYSIAYITPPLVSVRLQFSEYVSGAAHPLDGVVTLNYDTSSGTEMQLGDGFVSTARLLALLSTVARHDMRASLGADYAPDVAGPGTEPVIGNFASWAITEDGIEITFAEYQVGPYALGMPVVNVPWSKVRELVDPSGPLAVLAGS